MLLHHIFQLTEMLQQDVTFIVYTIINEPIVMTRTLLLRIAVTLPHYFGSYQLKKACFHDRELSAASELTGIAFTPSHAVEFAFASSLSEPQAIALLFS